jgi:hypothetical protein
VAAEIDETQLVGLSGHRHPLATPENMIGDVPSTQPMEWRRPGPEQRANAYDHIPVHRHRDLRFGRRHASAQRHLIPVRAINPRRWRGVVT